MAKIKFKATPAKTRLTEGTVRYQGPLAPGLYWFVIASRGNGELLRCQRRIRAV